MRTLHERDQRELTLMARYSSSIRKTPAVKYVSMPGQLAAWLFGLLSAVMIFQGTPVLAQKLYDTSLGSLPGDQDWSFIAVGLASQTYTGDAAQLDTSATASTQAGYNRVLSSPLNRTNGFALRFAVQVASETHANANRAGFSVIVLADDKRGIELGFWNNLIFAQSDLPLFTHAEEALFETAAASVDYLLTIGATRYLLRANGAVILSGPIRDYTKFNGLINPYRTPNYLFFGDDTTSASASVRIRDITLIRAPSLAMQNPATVYWNGTTGETYSVEASTNLIQWIAAGMVISTNTDFYFRNHSVGPNRYFRVVYP